MKDIAGQLEADREAEALAVALGEAERVVAEINGRWEERGLAERASVRLGTGSRNQPLFSFTVVMDLPADFDVDRWPVERFDQLDRELRAAVTSSPVDVWDWLTTARNQR